VSFLFSIPFALSTDCDCYINTLNIMYIMPFASLCVIIIRVTTLSRTVIFLTLPQFIVAVLPMFHYCHTYGNNSTLAVTVINVNDDLLSGKISTRKYTVVAPSIKRTINSFLPDKIFPRH